MSTAGERMMADFDAEAERIRATARKGGPYLRSAKGMEVRLRRKIVPYYKAVTGSRYSDVPADAMLREMRAVMEHQGEGRSRRRTHHHASHPYPHPIGRSHAW